MKKLSKAVVLLLVLAMVLSVVGCSSSDDKKDPATTTTPAASTDDKKDDKKEEKPAETDKKDDVKDDTSSTEPTDSNDSTDDTVEPDDEVVETKTFANGIYINEEGTYCNPDGSTVDLGGMEILMGDWFSKEGVEPTTAFEEATEEYRNEIMEKYNFKIKFQKISGYGTYLENFTNFATSGGDENYVFCLGKQMVATPMLSGLLYDLNTLDVLDFSEEKWDASTGYLTTQGKSTYGMRADAPEPRGGVFWNKRLFEEAGVDPDLPYDLQAKNEWTWETFEDLCKQLTRDTDNDGVNDCWAMTSFKGDFINAVIASNNAQLVDIDENGKYYLASNSDNYVEAYDWGRYMRQNYEMPSLEEETGDWAYMYPCFINAEAAMQVAEEYRAGDLSGEEGMADDFGFVMFPRGPKCEELTGYSTDNLYVIPSCYDADRAWKIAFAYNLFTEKTPGYEDDEDWMTPYYPLFKDERAVEETLALMRTHQVSTIWPCIPKLNTDNEYSWDLDAVTAIERYEAKKEEYESYIEAVNVLAGK